MHAKMSDGATNFCEKKRQANMSFSSLHTYQTDTVTGAKIVRYRIAI